MAFLLVIFVFSDSILGISYFDYETIIWLAFLVIFMSVRGHVSVGAYRGQNRWTLLNLELQAPSTFWFLCIIALAALEVVL